MSKPVNEWSNDDYNLANWNSKRNRAIFNVVLVSQFKVIANCTMAKDVGINFKQKMKAQLLLKKILD